MNSKKFLNEVKTTSIKRGDKFKLSADLGSFTKGEKIKVIDVIPSDDDIEIVLSNGKIEDSFFIDENDNFNEFI
jgi:hypothetical protein